ncbi:MAG TPA: DinB family protein [Puia sp.]|nr:DinB family protein [Puia sp.]
MEKAPNELFVTTVIGNWELALKRISVQFDRHPDADLSRPIASGRNRVIYLLGHLVAVHDNMIPLLGLGDRHYPMLDALFIHNPDDASATYPPAGELRQHWTAVNAFLTARFREWKPEEWLHRHTAVSAEDFAKEPHRNRLNVVLNRTGHVSYHSGQLALVNT